MIVKNLFWVFGGLIRFGVLLCLNHLTYFDQIRILGQHKNARNYFEKF